MNGAYGDLRGAVDAWLGHAQGGEAALDAQLLE